MNLLICETLVLNPVIMRDSLGAANKDNFRVTFLKHDYYIELAVFQLIASAVRILSLQATMVEPEIPPLRE